MNRLILTLKYPKQRFWAENFIYFYSEDNFVVYLLDIRSDEIVSDFSYREKENES
jgi:hypothetical protein